MPVMFSARLVETARPSLAGQLPGDGGALEIDAVGDDQHDAQPGDGEKKPQAGAGQHDRRDDHHQPVGDDRVQSPDIDFAQAGDVAGASADDPAELGLVVIAHRELLQMLEEPPAERKLHALAGAGHDQDREALKDDGGREHHRPHRDEQHDMPDRRVREAWAIGSEPVGGSIRCHS